jgi:Fe-S-cluster containining protein
MNAEEFNQQLAGACQQCQASCCKKGRLFLPRAEYDAILRHLTAADPAGLAEFQSRVVDHDAFLLYDQKDACQFLTAEHHCRLHALGIKPSECLWWPYHVYADAEGQLELRLATYCCDGHLAHGPDSPYPNLIKAQIAKLGPELLLAFRRHHAGLGATRPLDPPAAPPPPAQPPANKARSADGSVTGA